MKNHLKLIAGLMLALLIVSCSEGDKKNTQEKKDVVEKSETATNEPQVLVKEGIDYEVIEDKEQSSEPVVYEFFSYTCPHCYNLEPVMVEWKTKHKPAQVKFVQIPVYMEQVAHLTYGFYVAEELGVKDIIHPMIFTEWHEKKNIIRKKEDLIPLFEKAGIAASDFEVTYQSDEVAKKVARAKQMVEEFSILSFPQLIVNEKYKVKSYKNLKELLGKFALDNTK